MNVIIEGIDRTGKGTLIQGLQEELGYFQVLHYEKPKALKSMKGSLKAYQEQSFRVGMQLLNSGMPLIMDRFHLGELVYAKRYRKYSGEYALKLESLLSPAAKVSTVLVLLTADDLSVMQDDGLSFAYDKRGEEQQDFVQAFERSSLPLKLQLNVTRGGKYIPAAETLQDVLSFIRKNGLA